MSLKLPTLQVSLVSFCPGRNDGLGEEVEGEKVTFRKKSLSGLSPGQLPSALSQPEKGLRRWISAQPSTSSESVQALFLTLEPCYRPSTQLQSHPNSQGFTTPSPPSKAVLASPSSSGQKIGWSQFQ